VASHVIIDGYNLIRRTPRHADLERRSLETARRSLLDRLVVYKRATGHRLTIVFDGVVGGDVVESRVRDRGVDVVYTPRGITADETIARMARDTSLGAVVVVTADLRLARAVERRGAAVIDPADFDARLDLAAPSDAKPLEPDKAAAAEGRGPEEDDAEREAASRRDRRGNPHKASKTARRAAARLRKL
jgi:predicted RNA-binding protein with PIN domain